MLLMFDSSGPTPAFSANFMSGALPPGLTYTNSCTVRTYFGSDGLLKTASANEPIFEYDPVTRVLLGMRGEMEQRTNLLTYSEQLGNAAWSKAAGTISANSTTAPDGTLTADLFTESTASSQHYVLQNAVSGTGRATLTFHVKPNGRTRVGVRSEQPQLTGMFARFDLTGSGSVVSGTGTITALANGWYRCTATSTGNGNGASGYHLIQTLGPADADVYTGDGVSGIYVWGAQLEAGASASSYIPTTTAAVTRQPDVLTASSLSWFNASEGTVVFEGIVNELIASGRAFYGFNNGTTSNRIAGYFGASAANFRVLDTNVEQALILIAGAATGNVFRHASAFKANSFNTAFNGAIGLDDSAGTVPSITALSLGIGTSSGEQPFMGYFRRFDYYTRRLPDAQLQRMSRV